MSLLIWVEAYGRPILSGLYGIGSVTVVIGDAAVAVVPGGAVTVIVVIGVLAVTLAATVGTDRGGEETVGTPTRERCVAPDIDVRSGSGAAFPPESAAQRPYEVSVTSTISEVISRLG